MPLDPQVKALLEAGIGQPPIEALTPAEARASHEERARLSAGEPRAVAKVTTTHVPGSGGAIPVRIYHPLESAERLPGLVYFHGGGWVTGGLETHDGQGRALASGGGCVVVAVDYRLAPEHKFPAAVEDALAATRWVAEHADELGVDPRRLAVAGDSAGANLAAVVALLARDEGGPALTFQMLLYPVTDHRFDTPSYVENGTDYRLTRAGMEYYWNHYLRTPADGDDPRASPLRAASFAGLPPALIVTAEFDPLRDEGRAYADRLRAAGVPVDYRELPGLVHGFASQTGLVDSARTAVDAALVTLQQALAAAPASAH